MSTPLGGKRRDRKRLVRCAHRGLLVTLDTPHDTLSATCPHCGVSASVTRTELIAQEPSSYVPGPELLASRLRNIGIARRVSDGP